MCVSEQTSHNNTQIHISSFKLIFSFNQFDQIINWNRFQIPSIIRISIDQFDLNRFFLKIEISFLVIFPILKSK